MPVKHAALWLALGVASAATAQHPAWPSSTAGLEFRWENASESNTVPSAGPVDRLCRLVPSGEAMFNRFWAMSLAGGRFDAEPAMEGDLLAAVRAAGAFAFEMVVTPAHTDYQAPATVAKLGPLVVAQHGPRLTIADGAESASLGTMAAGVAHHVIVNVEDTVSAFLDGRAAVDLGLRLDPAAWSDAPLTFGGSRWHGDLEGVAIYGRIVGVEEAVANHRAYRARIDERTGLSRLTMRARLVHKRDPPRPTVYPDSLVVFDYRVEGPVEGDYGDKVLVAHYGNLNGERRRATADLRIGRVYRLLLEPFDDHPQLAAMHKVSNHEDVHLPVFFAVVDPVPD